MSNIQHIRIDDEAAETLIKEHRFSHLYEPGYLLDAWIDVFLDMQDYAGATDVYDQQYLEPFFYWIEMMATHKCVVPPFDVLPEVGERGQFPPNFKPELYSTESIRISLEGRHFLERAAVDRSKIEVMKEKARESEKEKCEPEVTMRVELEEVIEKDGTVVVNRTEENLI